ncbi:MAG: hypothetical protein ACE5EY_04390 [Anaerolineae bacterium]
MAGILPGSSQTHHTSIPPHPHQRIRVSTNNGKQLDADHNLPPKPAASRQYVLSALPGYSCRFQSAAYFGRAQPTRPYPAANHHKLYRHILTGLADAVYSQRPLLAGVSTATPASISRPPSPDVSIPSTDDAIKKSTTVRLKTGWSPAFRLIHFPHFRPK